MLRPLRLVWIDCLVVAATSLTFGAIALSQQPRLPGPPTERTIQAIADELGVTADEIHRATSMVPPPPRGVRLSESERLEVHRQIASLLNVPIERLDKVMQKYGPPPPSH